VHAVPVPDLIGTSRKEVAMPVPWGCPPPEQSREQICVIDDDEWVADSLKSLLESFCYDVQSYNSGADFLADNRSRPAGCLIIDQHMPGMDGLDVVYRLQKRGVRVPTILISGRLDASTKQRAASLGVAGVVEKHFAADRLVGLIRTALLERN
jgi:two-component system, LuxR family, response regulator FixJ